MRIITFKNEAATAAFAKSLASCLTPGFRIYLHGGLGAGKTTLVRGLLQALGWKERVKSPTYTLVEPYAISSLYLYHFDLYRLEHPDEFYEAGLAELFNDTAICIVEWPEQGNGVLPTPPDIRIHLLSDPEKPDQRTCQIEGLTERGRACEEHLAKIGMLTTTGR